MSVPLSDPTAHIVAGNPTNSHQINIADAAGQLATDPGLLFNSDTTLSDNVPTVSAADTAAGTITDPKLTQGTPQQYNASLTTGGTATTAPQQTKTVANGYTAATTQSQVAAQDMQGANGTVDPNTQIDPNQTGIDVNSPEFQNSATGQALQQYASQDLNTVDERATMKGQLEQLQSEFVDPTTGEPKIPAWAAATARSVSRIAAFTGMTGTAATAAMAQALMEASLPVAQADSQFYQTLTLKNLDNKQQSIINRANVLSKIDMANMDQRLTAAVENANKFMQMDMQNLSNDQQAAMINTQDRVQSILEDAKAKNTARLFLAQSQNEKDMFYSNLNSAIDQYNATQINGMKQFNASSANQIAEFNSAQENNRDQFYKDMQFQIDTANAKWRQTITMTANQQQFEAAATDVKDMLGVSQEMMNRLWDRADSLLDYAWKTSENEADRKTQISLMKLQNDAKIDEANTTGAGSLIGTLLGVGGNILLKAFGL